MPSPESVSVPLSPRAQEYFNKVFKPQYQALQKNVEQTPLAILVWGPGPAKDRKGAALYRKRQQIRDELRRHGHAAFFSEELPTKGQRALSQKGIEFLQAQAADLIVVMQASYGSVAEVHDFASYRVVNLKLLIFIDQAAKDGYSYRGALKELKSLYNNVSTYKYPDDIDKCNLLRKVLRKVGVLQMVKYRDMTNAGSWAQVGALGRQR